MKTSSLSRCALVLTAATTALSASATAAAPSYSVTFEGDVTTAWTQTTSSPGSCPSHTSNTGPPAEWKTEWANVVLRPRGPNQTFASTSVSFSATHTGTFEIEACNGEEGFKRPPCTSHATAGSAPATLTVRPNPKNPNLFTIVITALGEVKEDNPTCGTGFWRAAVTTEFTIAPPSFVPVTVHVSAQDKGSRLYQPLSDCSYGDMTCKQTVGWEGTVTFVRVK